MSAILPASSVIERWRSFKPSGMSYHIAALFGSVAFIESPAACTSMPNVRSHRIPRLVSGRRRGAAAAAMRGLLRAAEVPYTLAVGWRIAVTIAGTPTVHRVGVPVVSVGNLTLGGTGKTPMVKWLAQWFGERGIRVAIVSRGYGAAAGSRTTKRSNLHQCLPDVPHVQNPDRVAAAQRAIDELRQPSHRAGRRLSAPPPGPRPRHRAARCARAVRLRPCLSPRHAARAAHRFSAGPRRLPQPGRCRFRPSERDAIRERVAKLAPQAAWCELRPRASGLINSAGESQSACEASPASASPPSAASAIRPAFATRSQPPAARSPPGASFPIITLTRQPTSQLCEHACSRLQARTWSSARTKIW